GLDPVTTESLETMVQSDRVAQLVALVAWDTDERQERWEYVYEPDAQLLLDGLLKRYVESQVYQAVVEHSASPQAARMIAMKSATDNAVDIIDSLQHIYNKARQEAITQDISEIVGGAAAV